MQSEHEQSPEYLAYYGDETLHETTWVEFWAMWRTGAVWALLAFAALTSAATCIWHAIAWLERLVAP